MNELVGGLGLRGKELVDVPIIGIALHRSSIMPFVCSREQLCGTECHFQYFNSGQRYPRNHFLPSATKRLSTVGDGIWQAVSLIC